MSTLRTLIMTVAIVFVTQFFVDGSLSAQSVEEPDDENHLARYVGLYYFAPENHNVHVTYQGDELFVQPDGEERFSTQALSDTSFVLPQGIILSFHLDDTGEVKHAMAQKGEFKEILPPVRE